MYLRHTKQDGSSENFELNGRSFTIGRSHDTDLVLDDEKASRMHCGIRCEDGLFFVKDLQSKNGTYINGDKIESATLSNGDHLRIGSTILICEEEAPTGTSTAIHEVEEKMAQGKGYGTILKEIVGDDAPGAQ